MFAKSFIVALVLASTQALSIRVKNLRTPDVSTCLEGTNEWFDNISLDVQPWPFEALFQTL